MFSNIKRHNWTPAEYHQHPAVSNSRLTRMRKDPTTTFDKVEVNESMKLGSAFDDFLLLPDTFYRVWRVITDVESPSGENQTAFCRAIMAGATPDEAMDRAYKKPPMGAEEMAEKFAGWITLQTDDHALSDAQFNTLKYMKKSVMQHDGIVDLLNNSEKQVCFTAIHDETGLEVKGMLDILGESVECDLKTTSTHWNKINRFWMRDRGYDTQRAMYVALSGATGTGILPVSTLGRHRCSLVDCTGVYEQERWDLRLSALLAEYKFRIDNGAWQFPIGYYKKSYWEVLS